MFDLIKEPANKTKPSGSSRKHKPVTSKAVVQWTNTNQEALEHLLEYLTTSPILAYPDYKEYFILHTDASGQGLGAVL